MELFFVERLPVLFFWCMRVHVLMYLQLTRYIALLVLSYLSSDLQVVVKHQENKHCSSKDGVEADNN